MALVKALKIKEKRIIYFIHLPGFHISLKIDTFC